MELISAILAVIVGFAAGAAGLGLNQTSNQATPIDAYSVRMCYSPEPAVQLTLKWPDNFTFSDNRFTLYPEQYPQSGPFPTPIGYPTDKPPPAVAGWEQYKTRLTPVPNGAPKLASTNSCQTMMLTDVENKQVSTRTYIRVRRNLRSASCKIDEMAGPYNSTPNISCGSLYPGNTGSYAGAQSMRGTCDFSPYPDLRKVAEINSNGKNLEIFWVPVTHNVKCRYDPDRPNCPDNEPITNFNLRDFIYVLNKRDAFDPANPSGCVVKWDAGSTDKNACSHYFDVYLAEDVYNEMQKVTMPVPTAFPNYEKYYFLKQVMENCQEQNTFVPIVDTTGMVFPPTYLEKPFVASDFFLERENKIQPDPLDDYEVKNYTSFILTSPGINIARTSLIQTGQPSAGPLNVCTPPNTNNCYVPLGGVNFRKDATKLVSFKVYSHKDAPNTFILKDKSGQDAALYQYTVTEQPLVQNTYRAPALQLKSMEFSTENEWTWATPICKPAIYLYPAKPTDLNVKLRMAGQLTASDPDYDVKEGWNVKAYPDGKIESKTMNDELKTNNQMYPYLYYEADIKGIEIPKEGWVVEASSIKDKVSSIMREIGFNGKEIGDFLAYWLPRLHDKPYYFVTLLPQDVINSKETLSFSVNPDTLIRVRFVFEGLTVPLSVRSPANIPHNQRQGFVATDWGGTLIGKSCEDISVK